MKIEGAGRVPALFWLGCLCLTLAACGAEEASRGGRGGQRQDGRPGGGGRGPGGRPPAAAIPVKAEPVVRQDLLAYLETYSRLEAERQVTVLARTTGLVQRVHVEEGDRVNAGQVLVELDQEEASLRLRQARAEHAEAKANFERYKVLHTENMVSQAEFEGTRLRCENSEIGMEEAEIGFAHTTIRAPMGGVITQRMVELGDLVRGNQEIYVVADLDVLLVRIFIPERRMYQVRPGQEATIVVEALPEQTFDARIRRISPEVTAESGTVKVTLEVPASGLLKPGMFATVRLITERHPQTLVIPKKALLLETEEDDVFAIVDGKVRQVPVELGLIEGDRVEVLSGVTEGDMLITVGHDGLKEGIEVRVVGLETRMVADADSASGEDQPRAAPAPTP